MTLAPFPNRQRTRLSDRSPSSPLIRLILRDNLDERWWPAGCGGSRNATGHVLQSTRAHAGNSGGDRLRFYDTLICLIRLLKFHETKAGVCQMPSTFPRIFSSFHTRCSSKILGTWRRIFRSQYSREFLTNFFLRVDASKKSERGKM